MCGYDPFYWYDRLLDEEAAEAAGFDNLQDFYEWSCNECNRTDDKQRA